MRVLCEMGMVVSGDGMETNNNLLKPEMNIYFNISFLKRALEINTAWQKHQDTGSILRKS